MKLHLQVAMGSNESAVAEIELKDVEQWDTRVAPVLKKLEERVGERARRIMAGTAQLRELAKTSPEQANMVHNLVLVCMGQQPQAFVEGMVEVPVNIPTLERVGA